MKNQPKQTDQAGSKQPTHDVKLRRTNGEKTTYERLGAAWQRDDGSIYVRLHGTQIVAEGFTLYPVEQ